MRRGGGSAMVVGPAGHGHGDGRMGTTTTAPATAATTTARPRRSRGDGHAPPAVTPVRASQSSEDRQQGAGVVDHGVRVRQRLGPERAGRDRGHAHAVGARAGDVARRVADDDRALARPRRVEARGAGDRRQLARGPRASEPKPPWPAAKKPPMPARRELEPRDRLEVAGHEREPELVRPRGQRRQQLDDPGRQPSSTGRPGTSRSYAATVPRRHRARPARRSPPRDTPGASSRSRAIARSVRPAASTVTPSSASSPCTSAAASRSASACSPRRRCSSVPSMSNSSRSERSAPEVEVRAPGAARTPRSAAPRSRRRRAGPSRPASACSAAARRRRRSGCRRARCGSRPRRCPSPARTRSP